MTADNPVVITGARARWFRYAIIGLLIAMGLVALAGVVVASVLLLTGEAPLRAADVLGLAGLFVVSVAAAGLLLAALSVERQINGLSDKAAAIDQQTAVMAEQSVARTQADTYVRNADVDAARTRELLERIHEALLLPDGERIRRFKVLMEREFSERLAAIEHCIDTYDFHRAREELATMVERFGADPRIVQARQRLEKAAEEARASDIRRVSQRLDDLIAEARWDEAERAARELADRHPTAADAVALVDRVQRELRLFEQKHRQGMHEEIQRFVNERRWQEALKSGKQFLDTFPTGPDSDILRAQMPTLQANAEIQARQTLERYITQYIQQKQYWDALALARRIIAEYPLSPQANALRAQLPRLEELARRQAPQS